LGGEGTPALKGREYVGIANPDYASSYRKEEREGREGCQILLLILPKKKKAYFGGKGEE